MEHAEHSNSNAPMEYRSEIGRLNILGFWIFLGAEIALFSTLFATYAVLHNRTAGGVLPAELFDAKLVLIMTFLLLTSSFTCGIAVHEMRRGSLKGVMIWMIITLLLGAGFVSYELYEFNHYVHEGATLSTSAYWSAFFVLLGKVQGLFYLIKKVKLRVWLKRSSNRFFQNPVGWSMMLWKYGELNPEFVEK